MALTHLIGTGREFQSEIASTRMKGIKGRRVRVEIKKEEIRMKRVYMKLSCTWV